MCPAFDSVDLLYLRQAVELSKLSPPRESAFAVGCTIADPARVIVSTGYSREYGDDWHAEAVALKKLEEKEITNLAGFTLYSSLEPCSIRKSGKGSCCARILKSGLSRVVFGVREPILFVNCEGAEILAGAGIEIIELSEVADEVKAINAHHFKNG